MSRWIPSALLASNFVSTSGDGAGAGAGLAITLATRAAKAVSLEKCMMKDSGLLKIFGFDEIY